MINHREALVLGVEWDVYECVYVLEPQLNV